VHILVSRRKARAHCTVETEKCVARMDRMSFVRNEEEFSWHGLGNANPMPTDIRGNMGVRQRGSRPEINLLELSGSTHKLAHPGEPSNRGGGGGQIDHDDDAQIDDADDPHRWHNTRHCNRTSGCIQPCHCHSLGGPRDYTNTYTLQDVVRRTLRYLTHWGDKGSNR